MSQPTTGQIRRLGHIRRTGNLQVNLKPWDILVRCGTELYIITTRGGPEQIYGRHWRDSEILWTGPQAYGRLLTELQRRIAHG